MVGQGSQSGREIHLVESVPWRCGFISYILVGRGPMVRGGSCDAGFMYGISKVPSWGVGIVIVICEAVVVERRGEARRGEETG